MSGSNVFFSREELERLGGFDVRLGLIGDRLGVGEETELFHRLWLEKPSPVAVYSPAIVVRHPVAPHKLSVRYQLRRAAAHGEYEVIRQPALRLRQRPYLALVHLRELVHLSRAALSRIRRPIRRWALDELEPAAVRFGMLRAVITGR